MNYEILADVSIDLSPEFLAENQVKFVPMQYMIGEESHLCNAPESNEMMHEYYNKLRNKVETRTSQITPFHYFEAFEPYVKDHIPLIYICLSSGLSDTYNSALSAVNMLKEEYEDVQIEVVDSLGATGGMGLLAEKACENRAAGMGLTENAAWLREKLPGINYWFKVQDLMYLSRGGRISAAAAVVGTALSLRPILTIRLNGKLDTMAKKRGDKQAMRHLVDQFESNFDPSMGTSVYICCSDCFDAAEELKAALLDKRPELNVHITMLSPIIGAHTGPDMLSVIYFGTSRD